MKTLLQELMEKMEQVSQEREAREVALAHAPAGEEKARAAIDYATAMGMHAGLFAAINCLNKQTKSVDASLVAIRRMLEAKRFCSELSATDPTLPPAARKYFQGRYDLATQTLDHMRDLEEKGGE